MILKTNPSRQLKVKNIQKPLVALFLNMMMLAKRKILKTFQMKAKNHVMMLTKRKILKTFQMRVNNLHKPLIAIIQNVMVFNFSLQVKKKI
jgi:hypothetical protein